MKTRVAVTLSPLGHKEGSTEELFVLKGQAEVAVAAPQRSLVVVNYARRESNELSGIDLLIFKVTMETTAHVCKKENRSAKKAYIELRSSLFKSAFLVSLAPIYKGKAF